MSSATRTYRPEPHESYSDDAYDDQKSYRYSDEESDESTMSSDQQAQPVYPPEEADAPERGEPYDAVWREWRTAIARGSWISQLFLIAAVTVASRTPVVGIPVALVILLFIANTVIRVRGRHPHQWLAARIALPRRRRRTQRAPLGPDALGPLSLLLPQARLASIPGVRDKELGIVYDGAGWAAVLAVGSIDDDEYGAATIECLIRAAKPAVAGTRAQVVFQQPGLESGEQGYAFPCETWIVIRIDAAEGGSPASMGTAGVAVVLRTAVRRVSAAIAEAGFSTVPLDAEELRLVLESTMESPLTTPDLDAEELWNTWSCQGRTHVTFQIPVWSAEVLSEVLYLTSTAIGTMTTVSLPVTDGQRSLVQGPGPAWLRVSHSDRRRLSAVARALPDALRPAGVRLHPADGRQAPALLATIPLGRSLS